MKEATVKDTKTKTLKLVLSIAGSDSSGGAGIQADLKAMSANGVYGMSVLTSVTAQNTQGVTAIHDLPVSIIEQQLDAIFDDFDLDAIKTGMLSSSTIVDAVCQRLLKANVTNLVVDPVMVSKSGHTLLQPDAVEKVKKTLIPMALLVTPNIPEAECLSGLEIRTLAVARQAAKLIHRMGCRNVLIKGGHLLLEKGVDLLYDGKFFNMYKSKFFETPHTHGTGCTYASTIAAHLARGKSLPDAVQVAKTYITEAIRNGLAIGHGKGPTNHFYFLND